MTGDEGLRLEDIVDLDENAAPAINSERARQQAEFHAREAREIAEIIAADPSMSSYSDRAQDPRQADRLRHAELETVCREIGAAFDWLTEKRRPSADIDRALQEIRERYDTADETRLLREIAETYYPLLTTVAESRQGGTGLLSETKLSIKHAARGRPLADAMTADEAAQILSGWLARAGEIQSHRTVHITAVRQAIESLAHLARRRSDPDQSRTLVDDLEAAIYLARATLDGSGFTYIGPDEPARSF